MRDQYIDLSQRYFKDMFHIDFDKDTPLFAIKDTIHDKRYGKDAVGSTAYFNANLNYAVESTASLKMALKYVVEELI